MASSAVDASERNHTKNLIRRAAMHPTREVVDMALARFGFLSKDEEDLIHEKSLEVLDGMGVLVRSKHVLSMLADAGAVVDARTKVAKLPEDIVRGALKDAPGDFHLCARERENDIALPTCGAPHMTTDGLTVYMLDLDTGERRNAIGKDYADFARLADALDAVDFFWPIVTISDVRPEGHNLHELWTAFKNCTLHVQGDCTSAEHARTMIELGALVAGGAEELRRRPLFSCATDPVSPLSFDAGPVEAQAEFARAGVPVLCHSMAMSGMSSPVTVAGTIVTLNSENLASTVISQCASRGAPHIYGSCSAPADMMTGSINFLAPESVFISAAAGQMARRYGMPCMVANWGMGGKGPGMRLSMPEAFSYTLGAFAGSDLVSGIGGLDSAMGCSMGQMVLDSILWEDFRSFLRDVAVDAGAAALDVLQEVGHGNSFLAHPHTARNFRKELHIWNKDHLALETMPPSDMMAEADRTAKRILDQHEVPPLDNHIVETGDLLLKVRERKALR